MPGCYARRARSVPPAVECGRATVVAMPGGTIGRTSIRLPAADLGPDSPLPAFAGLQRLPDPSLSPGLPAEMRHRIEYGRLANPLPYPVQDGYQRKLRLSDLPAAAPRQ